jgi:hypothetical protein
MRHLLAPTPLMTLVVISSAQAKTDPAVVCRVAKLQATATATTGLPTCHSKVAKGGVPVEAE